MKLMTWLPDSCHHIQQMGLRPHSQTRSGLTTASQDHKGDYSDSHECFFTFLVQKPCQNITRLIKLPMKVLIQPLQKLYQMWMCRRWNVWECVPRAGATGRDEPCFGQRWRGGAELSHMCTRTRFSLPHTAVSRSSNLGKVQHNQVLLGWMKLFIFIRWVLVFF